MIGRYFAVTLLLFYYCDQITDGRGMQQELVCEKCILFGKPGVKKPWQT
jgi:hypothetical protein